MDAVNKVRELFLSRPSLGVLAVAFLAGWVLFDQWMVKFFTVRNPPAEAPAYTNLVLLSYTITSNAYSFTLSDVSDNGMAQMKANWTMRTNIVLGFFNGTNRVEVISIECEGR